MANIELNRWSQRGPVDQHTFQPYHASVSHRPREVGTVIESRQIGDERSRVYAKLVLFETGECVWYDQSDVTRLE